MLVHCWLCVWCSPADVLVLWWKMDAGTLCHLVLVLPTLPAQCGPPFGIHLYRIPFRKQQSQHQLASDLDQFPIFKRNWAFVLTHIELPDETGHVVVFEEFWKNLFGEPTLIEHMEAGSTLSKNNKKIRILPSWLWSNTENLTFIECLLA